MARVLPEAYFRYGFADLQEGQSGLRNLLITLTLSAVPEAPVYVSYATSNGSAVAGEDYVARVATLSFAAGETEKAIRVQLLGDTLFESNETFYLDLTRVTGDGVLSPDRTSALLTIVNDDARPLPLAFLTRAFFDMAEGQSGARNMVFTIGFSEPPLTNVRVSFSTSNGSAVAGQDYTARSGAITFAPGETSRNFAVALLPDTTPEDNETFYVEIFGVTGGAVLDASRNAALATIVNDDAPTAPQAYFVTAFADAQEGAAGSRNLLFTVGLTAAPLSSVRVGFTTTNGAARAGEDYVARAGALTFLPGETRKSFGVAILGDAVDEADETFYAELTVVTGGGVLDGSRALAIATIVNDDPPTMTALAMDSIW